MTRSLSFRRLYILLLLNVVGCSLVGMCTASSSSSSSSTTAGEDDVEKRDCTQPNDEHGTCPTGDDSAVNEDDEKRLKILLKVLPTKQFYINGTWADPIVDDDDDGGGDLLDVIDPSTTNVITQIPVGGQSDVDTAVKAAKEAFHDWNLKTTPLERRQYVERILSIYYARQDDIGLLISREMGAPIDMARSSQAGAAIYHTKSFFELFDKFDFVRTLPQYQRIYDPPDVSTTILMDPIGVVGMITPWNWPINQIVLKVIPALLVGCTCVLKPSELSPLSAILFGQIVHEAKLPPGVFNLINGDGPTTGQVLSSHPNVDMISFTGSTCAGAQISKAAADTFKKVTLELGGKGANIIFDDITNEWADEVLRDGADIYYNSGQSCNAASRMFVQRSLYDRAIQIAIDVASSTNVDSAHKHGHDHIGPVVSLRQYERIQNYIQSGIDEGATLLVGGLGKPDTHLRTSPGYYVQPTVFANCTRSMKIFREEIFGPVLCIIPFDTEAEVVELANDTPYGLTNYVYSRNVKRRQRLAHALRSGMVEMNDAESDVGSPFGGTKASGIGREGGIYGLEEYCEIKSVTGYYEQEDDLL